MVRIRQLLEQFRYRLFVIPLVLVLASIVLARVTLAIDAAIDPGTLPNILVVSVDSGRAVLGALAGGLISSVTLLLSLMLVAVQLASSQFSPRTSRDWLADRTQQVAIGTVLAAAVYCLVVLRETRTLDGEGSLTPNISVLVALVLGVLALLGVVSSVDELANSVRISAVARRIMVQTVAIIEREEGHNDNRGLEPPVPIAHVTPGTAIAPVPDDPDEVTVIEAADPGWLQQIDANAILHALPEGTTCRMAAPLGGFILPSAPVMTVHPKVDDEVRRKLLNAIAIGDTRTMQQDVGFGILRLVDVAMRALSPGINDPNTAKDVIVHLGAVMIKLWERPPAQAEHHRDGRMLAVKVSTHGELLHSAFDPIRRYGADDPDVILTIIETLSSVRAEAVRRRLPGPVAPIDQLRSQFLEETVANHHIHQPDRDRFEVAARAATQS